MVLDCESTVVTVVVIEIEAYSEFVEGTKV